VTLSGLHGPGRSCRTLKLTVLETSFEWLLSALPRGRKITRRSSHLYSRHVILIGLVLAGKR
jgi:hypothetical protein